MDLIGSVMGITLVALRRTHDIECIYLKNQGNFGCNVENGLESKSGGPEPGRSSNLDKGNKALSHRGGEFKFSRRWS